MVKDHSDSERGNPLPPHGLLFPININGSFICIIPQTVVEREITQWVHPMKDRCDDPSQHERTLLPRIYISLLFRFDIANSNMVMLKISSKSALTLGEIPVYNVSIENTHDVVKRAHIATFTHRWTH